jgi:hypothetical protein
MIRMSLFQRVDRHRKGRAAMLLTIMSTTMLDIGPWLARHDGRHGDRHPGATIVASHPPPALLEREPRRRSLRDPASHG